MYLNGTDNPKHAKQLKRTKTMKHRIVLKAHDIRKANAFLKNWANETETDETYHQIMDGTIRTKSGKAVLKGWNVW